MQYIGVTPNDLMKLYGIPTAKATQTRNLLSVTGFLRQFANREDLTLFLGTHRLDLIKATFTDQSIDGGQNIQTPGSAGEEANLDIQYTVGLVNFAPVEFISSGLSSINGWINLADHWLAQDNPPTVVSISYGFNKYVLSKDSTNTLSNHYAQLGARGVSILVSTGDGGVAGSQPPSGGVPYEFIPTQFPASCPYVTAVGATKGNPEVAAPFSAGGFSNYFSRDQAPYQKNAVDGYLDQIGSLYEDHFDRNGRAYPDISAQGENIFIVLNQNHKFTGGTSASTPINASIITLLNDCLIEQKGRSLGFLNPLLYANPTVLNDITEGSNLGSGTDGFPAKSGWDPVMGLGTPNFPKMAEAIGV
ncbi:hypothetical protein APHAL10511_002311 [Amanita phalloides]|nr:hypothetical protein APHAL10511_002311 [Amanita phalloides]